MQPIKFTMATDRVQFNRRDKASDPFVMHDTKLQAPTGWENTNKPTKGCKSQLSMLTLGL